ncbi:hypothetical protein FB451DRAFT_1220832 [Mycena latifolia]|nr:hypothetical protein FB451DRAFT_1220832 [Mycena latifolia]
MRNLELHLSSGKRIKRMIGSFLRLEKLTIAPDPYGVSPALKVNGCIELMRVAPNLVECDFDGFFDNHRDCAALTHTSLRRLRLGQQEDDDNSASILRHLTLPALQILDMTNFDLPQDVLLSFLRRSAPPLKSLCMVSPWEDWPSQSICRFFRLIPGLTDLNLVVYGQHCGLTFLGVLATSIDLLPNLSRFIDLSLTT